MNWPVTTALTLERNVSIVPSATSASWGVTTSPNMPADMQSSIPACSRPQEWRRGAAAQGLCPRLSLETRVLLALSRAVLSAALEVCAETECTLISLTTLRLQHYVTMSKQIYFIYSFIFGKINKSICSLLICVIVVSSPLFNHCLFCAISLFTRCRCSYCFINAIYLQRTKQINWVDRLQYF